MGWGDAEYNLLKGACCLALQNVLQFFILIFRNSTIFEHFDISVYNIKTLKLSNLTIRTSRVILRINFSKEVAFSNVKQHDKKNKLNMGPIKSMLLAL